MRDKKSIYSNYHYTADQLHNYFHSAAISANTLQHKGILKLKKAHQVIVTKINNDVSYLIITLSPSERKQYFWGKKIPPTLNVILTVT